MPVLQPCKPLCVAEATWGCDYPSNPSIGDYHFDGGGQNRFDVWDGTNWVAASFEPDTVITILRDDPWLDLVYRIGANGVSFTDITVSSCGRDVSVIDNDEHRVLIQRCVPVNPDCDPSCDCLSGPQQIEGISWGDFIATVAAAVAAQNVGG